MSIVINLDKRQYLYLFYLKDKYLVLDWTDLFLYKIVLTETIILRVISMILLQITR